MGRRASAPALRALLVAVSISGASGCAVVDAQYFVHGTVWRKDGGRVPLAGATATVPQCVPRENPTEIVTADSEGRFAVKCWYGGMCLFFLWCPGVAVPDTTLTFSARGFKPESVKLLGKRSDDRVVQGRCDTPRQRGCYQVDVLLEPEGSRDSGRPVLNPVTEVAPNPVVPRRHPE